VLSGAFVTGFLFMLLKAGITFYFAKAEPGSVYGAAGSVVLIMLWVAISSMVLFFGAEFTRQYARYNNIHVETKKGKD
jgi:membrane protein